MQNRSNSCNNNSNGKKQKPQVFFVWGESRAPLQTKTVNKTRPICAHPAGWRIFAVSWLPLQNLLGLSAMLPLGPMPIAFLLQRQQKTKKFCYANEQGDHIKRCSYNSTTEREREKKKTNLRCRLRRCRSLGRNVRCWECQCCCWGRTSGWAAAAPRRTMLLRCQWETGGVRRR